VLVDGDCENKRIPENFIFKNITLKLLDVVDYG
jgi:hypothetical protein